MQLYKEDKALYNEVIEFIQNSQNQELLSSCIEIISFVFGTYSFDANIVDMSDIKSKLFQIKTKHSIIENDNSIVSQGCSS